MNKQEFEQQIQDYWVKVQSQYAPLVAPGGLLENKDYYVFQTKYHYQPELMIIGINPGGNGVGSNGWLTQDSNSYTTGDHPWFQTLRDAFGYPNNEVLSPILENCVGTNKCFINTGSEKDLPKEINRMCTMLIRELVAIIQPKRIFTLGEDVFCTIKNKPTLVEEFGNIKFKHSLLNNVPVGYLPNPTNMHRNSYYTKDKLQDWQDALMWFITNKLE